MNTVDVFVQVAVEGTVDKAVALKLIQHVGAQADTVHVAYGKQRLLKKVSGYNQAAKGQPWLVLVDLDRCNCAPALVQKWVSNPSPYFCLRVAVREVEAWLLADAKNLAHFLGVPMSLVPSDPETVNNPKQEMVALAAQSRKRAIREDMVPDPNAGQKVGSGYSARLIEFVENHWDIMQAAQYAPSLQRAVDCLNRIVHRYRALLLGREL